MKKEIKVLAIDSATRACSAALVLDGVVAGENFLYGQKNHSENLMTLIDDLFRNTGVSPEDIDLVAVSSGPGSFTGLRVGISTAQGLAFALGKDLAGISTLDILAFQANIGFGYICPMIDAKKNQIFTCLYKCSGSKLPEKTIDKTVVEPEKWLMTINSHKPVLFLGDGAWCYHEAIETAFRGDYTLLPPFSGIPRASTLGCIAVERHLKNRKNELDEIVPFYIRPPDAEANLRKKSGSFNPATHKK